MKFTEAHFNKLVMLQEKEYPNNVYSSSRSDYNNIDEALKKYDSELYRFVEDNDVENQVVALMNLETREWAHDKFVEKEKKSHFVLKDVRDDNGNLYHLIESGGAVVLNPWLNSGYQPKIKESDVRKWGFNPEMFDREEV